MLKMKMKLGNKYNGIDPSTLPDKYGGEDPLPNYTSTVVLTPS